MPDEKKPEKPTSKGTVRAKLKKPDGKVVEIRTVTDDESRTATG